MSMPWPSMVRRWRLLALMRSRATVWGTSVDEHGEGAVGGFAELDLVPGGADV